MAEKNGGGRERKASWATRHLSFQQRPAASAPLLDDDEVRYVERCSGRYLHDYHGNPGNNNDHSAAARACMIHLRSLVDGRWWPEWDDLLDPEFAAAIPGDENGDSDDARKVIRLGEAVAVVLRKHEGISLRRLIQKLQASHVLRGGGADADGDGDVNGNGNGNDFNSLAGPSTPRISPSPVGSPGDNNNNKVDLRDDLAAQSLVFSLLGWLSLLYIPAPAPAAIPAPGAAANKPTLRISLQSRSTLRSHIPAETAGRPLDQLLRSFGDLLPKKDHYLRHDYHYRNAAGRSPTDTGLQLEVAQLNVSALQEMAGVQIVWVDALSGHLDFDTAGPTPTLCLFKCPSFCKLHRSDASLLDTMLSRFYEDDEKPSRDFSAAKLLGEIILSYDLLFRASKRSRALYASTERAKASLGSQTDPYLDELCGYGESTRASGSPERIFFDAAADFPIFQDRLRRIQDHMKGVQPTGFWALWRDQRDLRLWYTIWVVLILTVIGLIIAVVSAVLAGVQVNLAKQAIELQIQQNNAGSN